MMSYGGHKEKYKNNIEAIRVLRVRVTTALQHHGNEILSVMSVGAAYRMYLTKQIGWSTEYLQLKTILAPKNTSRHGQAL